MWTRKHHNFYTISKYFGKYKYVVSVFVEETDKSLKYWVGASSGRKRKQLDIFEQKSDKSFGGIKALLWIKSCIFEFPKTHNKYVHGRKEYICIQWSDSRRRDIYSRLIKYGFEFQMIGGEKTLIKRL